MGDVIEFNTNRRDIFPTYKISTNELCFEVKANGNALIGLSHHPPLPNCELYDYEVKIGIFNRHTSIQTKHIMEEANTYNILNPDVYKKFTMSWYGPYLCFGTRSPDTTILRLELKSQDMSYLTFGVIGNDPSNIVHWRFELPPVRDSIPLKHIKSGTIRWVDGGNQLPDDALIAGYENECLYITRAKCQGSLTPGKFRPSEGVASISWGGDGIMKEDFEVLCGYNVIWQRGHGQMKCLPPGAVVGGHAEHTREILYIGRAHHEGHLIPGKVQLSHTCCYISFEGKEVAKREFEFLFDPQVSRRCIGYNKISDVDVYNRIESDDDD